MRKKINQPTKIKNFFASLECKGFILEIIFRGEVMAVMCSMNYKKFNGI